MPDHNRFGDWIERYERAWRTAGTGPLAGLFAADASYLPDPYAEPAVGLEAIGVFWEEEREGADEAFSLTSELVAVEGKIAVARIEVVYGDPPERSYRDLWVIELGPDGRCRAFEEWPFFPGRPRAAE
jgi:hypothetical protein